MIEIKYVKKLTCDRCGNSEEAICGPRYIDDGVGPSGWMKVKFEYYGTNDGETKHLCPECSKKLLALFENSEEKEEEDKPDNLDADGNTKRCDKCFYYERNTRYIGKCTHIDKFVAAISHCSDYSGM